MLVILATQKADRDQEDRGSKPARVNSSADRISEYPTHKNTAGGVA
jgi:hypothetical protein